MPRTAGHVAHKKKVRRVLKAAKGYYGARSKLLVSARDTVVRAGVYAYRDRRARKRDFRTLWITRITAACRARGLPYNKFIRGLKNALCDLNRKMLSEIAIADPTAFDLLVDLARKYAAKAA